MAKSNYEHIRGNAAGIIAALMAASARTAPKARGVDDMEILVIDGADLEELAAAMERKAAEKTEVQSSGIKRDANNVRVSSGVLLLGVRGNPKKIERPLDCGACGYASCAQLAKARERKRTGDFSGPICIFQAMDLGIAMGSAVKLASEIGVDNRIMYSIGIAAKALKLLDSDIIIGIPLSLTGKNPYFDR